LGVGWDGRWAMGGTDGRCFCGRPRAVASSFIGIMVDKARSFLMLM